MRFLRCFFGLLPLLAVSPSWADPLGLLDLNELALGLPQNDETFVPQGDDFRRVELPGELALWFVPPRSLMICEYGDGPAIGSVLVDMMDAHTNLVLCPELLVSPVSAVIAGLTERLLPRYAERLGAPLVSVQERFDEAVTSASLDPPVVCTQVAEFLAPFATPDYEARMQEAMLPDHLPAVSCPDQYY